MYPIFLLTYTILGGGIKYIDDAFDRDIFSKKTAYILSPILAIIGVYCMIINPVSATILLAILAGVLIKGKIDNLAFISAFILVILLSVGLGIEFLIIPLILLSAAAMIDEVGNDFIDSIKDRLDKEKITNKFAIYFFGHRWVLKIAILFLVIANIVPLYFFFAMVLFDYTYVAVGIFGKLKSEDIKITHTPSVISKIACIFK